jgi:hypothetical protein
LVGWVKRVRCIVWVWGFGREMERWIGLGYGVDVL